MTSRRKPGRPESGEFPVFEMFGPEPRRLKHQEAIDATAERRIESVWPFLIRKTIQFVETLRGCERSNCDAEDVLLELYIELANKNDKWEPDRGRYITFAGKLAQRYFSSFRDRLRTVHSPRNSLSRMEEYERDIEQGTITADRLDTYESIKKSSMNYGSFDPDGVTAASHVQQVDLAVEDRESERLTRDAITWGIMTLTTFESRVMGMSHGLWGQPILTTAEIAERTGKSREAVQQARSRALLKVRERLLAMGHPAVASDN